MTKDSQQLIITGIAIIAIIGGIVTYLGGADNLGFNKLSSQEVGQSAINFINANVLQPGITASLVDIADLGNIYKIRLKIEDQEYDSFITKDGKYLFPEGFDLTAQADESDQEISKRDVPDVRLFVMSYCPYGLQAQKMFLPVYDLLKDQAQMGVYFVDYIMHEKIEIDENLRQYCIQKDQQEKYRDYLGCFVKDGDYNDCLLQAGIDQSQLENCIADTDKEYNIYSQYQDQNTWLNGNFPKFDVHTDLNSLYGVEGSPTVVINDKVVEVNPRSPERFKEVICSAFTVAPQECSQTLSDTAFSPSFGLEQGDSSSSSEGCGP